MIDEILHLIGVVVGRGGFHRSGQVEDQLFFSAGTEGLQHAFANGHGALGLAAREGLGGELVADARALVGPLPGQLHHEAGALLRHLDYPRHIGAVHHLTEEGADIGIQMHNGVFTAFEGLVGALDQMFPRLG